MQLNLWRVGIVQDIETRRLHAYYGAALLWSKEVEEPGCSGEATEFYTDTLITLLDAWRKMSNHARMTLLAAGSMNTVNVPVSDAPILGLYCDA